MKPGRRFATIDVMRRGWLIPAGLVALAAIPVLAGALRLGTLAGGAGGADDARFAADPVPVVIHIVGATVYCVLGAFQFAPGLRRRRPRWHRAAGRLLVPCGLAAALSGLWMTLVYPLPPTDGPLLNALRLLFGSAMAAGLVLGFLAIRRRDVARHRAWMIRAYAIGIAAGTQAFTIGIGFLVFGPSDQVGRALLMGAGWVVNLAVAEVVIQRPPVRRPATIRVEV
jgi:uncharacterized membrane protein